MTAPVKNLTQAGFRVQLGHGERTISQSGCVLTCLAMAANTLNRMMLTVTAANDILRATKQAFYASALNFPVAFKKFDLKIQRRTLDDAQRVIEALEAGNCLVMLGVDYRKGKSSAISEADHFVLAHTVHTMAGMKMVIAADPATGHDVHFEISGLPGNQILTCHPSPKVLWKAVEMTVITPKDAK